MVMPNARVLAGCRAAVLCAAMGVAAACSSSTAPAAPFFGTYQLVTVNGHAVPETDEPDSLPTINSGILTVIGGDTAAMDLALPGGLEYVISAEFTIRANRLILWMPTRAAPLVIDTGTIDSAGVTVAHHWFGTTILSLRFQR